MLFHGTSVHLAFEARAFNGLAPSPSYKRCPWMERIVKTFKLADLLYTFALSALMANLSLNVH